MSFCAMRALLPLLLCLATSALAAERKLNVLFIAVDDLRPDIGCYGNSVVKTPNLDRLGKAGMIFTKAYCSQAVCSPSRTSMLTGHRPDSTRVWDLETHFRVALPNVVTLPQHFKNNGYFVQGMGKIYHGGFDDGPSWSVPWGAPNAEKFAKKESSIGDKGAAFENADVADDFYLDGKVARLAAQTLSELKKKDQPFFLAVGFAKPHLPFVAPKKYWDLYDRSKIPGSPTDKLPEGAPEYAGHNNSELHSYGNIPKGNPIPEDLARELRHGYYAATSYMDAQLGLVLDALDREGLADKTVIVLWGDHGWQLGEHGLWHKHTNYELAARAPLFIAVPSIGTAGQKSASLAEFVDVYPTLADVCGLPKVEGLAGVSLKPVLQNPAASVNKHALSQYPRKAPEGNVMGYSIRTDRWRLVLWRTLKENKVVSTELYDEDNDPDETVNIASKPEHKAVVEELSQFLPPPIPPASGGAPIPSTKGGKKGNKGSKVEAGLQPAAVPTGSSTPAPASPSASTPPHVPGAEDVAAQRGASFDKRDLDKNGKLTKEEFMAKQKDPEHAAQNFLRFDKDKSGDINREEYIKMGK